MTPRWLTSIFTAASRVFRGAGKKLPRPRPGQLRTARSTFLTLGGFACFVVSAFIVGTVAGLIVLGLSCWLIEYLTGGGSR